MRLPKLLRLTPEEWDAFKKRLEQYDLEERDLNFIKKMADLIPALEKAVKEDDEEEMMRLLRLTRGMKP